ncbi:hypothetical protein EVAR_90970_1 [Eumeta japonica]|uniref:Uncharacterized protein n=1 Tax=Eumeta variegata TaxID=151549 RepID=A0A4C1Z6V4_EUMVA|nr:hypothetical protein EVAR_90970_1 [Eumeta japonica]
MRGSSRPRDNIDSSEEISMIAGSVRSRNVIKKWAIRFNTLWRSGERSTVSCLTVNVAIACAASSYTANRLLGRV